LVLFAIPYANFFRLFLTVGYFVVFYPTQILFLSELFDVVVFYLPFS